MTTVFCIEAVAVKDYGTPEILNTDQSSQLRWCDNVFVERFWRSLKYEEV